MEDAQPLVTIQDGGSLTLKNVAATTAVVGMDNSFPSIA